MKRIAVYIIAFFLYLCLSSGCGMILSQPRFKGKVQSHVDAYRSGTGGTSDLINCTQMGSGFHYGEPKKTDWNSEIHWKFVGYRGESDVYRFSRVFSPVGGASVSDHKEVEYNGKEPVIVFQNDAETVSIEPGSISDHQNSPQSKEDKTR